MASNDETNPVSDNIRSDKLNHSQSNRRKKKQDKGKNSGNNANRIGTMEFLKTNVNNSKKYNITIDSIQKSYIWLKHNNGKTKLNLGFADDKINELLTKNSENEKNDIKIEKINRYNSSLNKKIIAFPLILILIGEILLYKGYFDQALLIHIFNLLVLSFSTIIIQDKLLSNTFQALSLLPILRILNMAMPIFFHSTLYWYPFMYGCIFISAIYIIKHQKFTREQIGLNFEKMHIYFPIALIVGFILGTMEFQILQNPALIENLEFENILLISIIMTLFVGLAEELAFRSIIQTRFEQIFGTTQGLIITGIMFGIMHSGYGTIYEIIFTSSAGILLGYMFIKTRSLFLISTTHGFINIFLFGILPFYDLIFFK
ncbi:MAG TPA: CPBP family intramembrane metalloprotease [Methanosarcinaceae archaeon]|nr:CPBP family intramembrane metalloprotease [Methanosarcinaceae archaeon]HJH30999.1 CPBP family intramembrane metalloprotease [Methanosarcinaceae archaeon]